MPTVERRAFEPSSYQKAIFDWFEHGHGHLLTRARAGCGKTSSILLAIDRAPEQRILLCAFNKRIQTEMAERLTNPRAEALTLHALGYRAIRNSGGVTRTCARFEREDDLATNATKGMPYGAKRLVAKLVTKAREIQPIGATVETLIELALDFDLVPPPGDSLTITQVAQATLCALHTAAVVRPVATGIDFADMIFLPLVNNLVEPAYDMVVVDEAQDMTTAQLELARRACVPGGRFVIVGDDRQAIYGFRGADCASLDRLKKELNAQELPLSKTYRCPKLVVAIAQKYVPDYEVDSTAPEGTVATIERLDELVDAAQPADFILSRRNAPLARVALRLLRAGKPAKIQGRDIGAGLKALVRLLATGEAANSIPALLKRLTTYEEKQTIRLIAMKHEDRVDTLRDKCETLRWLAEDVSGVSALHERIDSLFTDEPGASVICSSVHKAKGLEAERVFILRSTFFMPVPCGKCRKRIKQCGCVDGFVADMAKQTEENNLMYVAVTRSKNVLTFCMEGF